jgi:hypothetical protein
VCSSDLEFLDDYFQNIVELREKDEAVVDDCALTLTPVAESIAGREWQGFSLTFSFKSSKRKIHRVMIHSTWEIGGTITGNTVFSQGQCNMPVYRGKKSDLFTTACLRRLDLYGKRHANSFQLGPRGGLIQGFDFQTAKQGSLVQNWPKLGSISSLIESKVGSDLLHTVDEYRFVESGNVTLPEKRILFSTGKLAEHEGFNVWKGLKDYAYGASCKRYGITPTRVRPEFGGEFFGWPKNKHDETLWMRIGNVVVPNHEYLYAVAEHALPAMAKQGVKRYFTTKHFSDVTECGTERKIDGGVHGGMFCASICATHRFFPSEFWGGIKGWKALVDKGHALGMEIGCWLAPHFSPRAAIFKEHPEYLMKDVTGLPAGGGYGKDSIIVADWNTGIADWVLDDLKRLNKDA